MSNSEAWPVEMIPDEAFVFYRVPVGFLRADKLPHPGVFKENGGSMSVDWDKYSTAHQTRNRVTKPENFAVVKLSAAGIREIRRLVLQHDPINEVPNLNRAHSSVTGINIPADIDEIGYKERVQSALNELTGLKWEIPPGSPVEVPPTI